jgi:hypothetical protein
MNSYFVYLLEVSVASAILYFGFLVLSQHTSVRFRRIYLLGCLLSSLVIPLTGLHVSSPVMLPIQTAEVAVKAIEQQPQLAVVPVGAAGQKPVSEVAVVEPVVTPFAPNIFEVIWWAYLAVAIFFVFRLVVSVYSIVRLSTKATLYRSDQGTFFVVDKDTFTGASFFKLIFIGRKLVGTPEQAVIYRHEAVHAARWHSVDLLLSELYAAVCWLNPMAWLIKSQVRLQTEYEADEAMMSHVDRKIYSHMLINLSSTLYYERATHFFSAESVKKRIKSLHVARENKRYRGLAWACLFYGLAFITIACVEPWEGEGSYADQLVAMENIKTITTRFYSHQNDTQDKDDKIIAVAYYHPDGTIDRVDQHMTYPYNYKNEFRREFWADPDPINVPLIMDGLELGASENNILYGNDWPKKYLELVLRKAHPAFGPMSELLGMTSTVEGYENGLPLKIVTREAESRTESQINQLIVHGKGKSIYMRPSGYEDVFEYSDGKVVMFSGAFVHETGQYDSATGKKSVETSINKNEVKYSYEGEKTSTVSQGNKLYRFFYENDLLKRTEYFIAGQMYHYKDHFYNSDGLRIRTEIYNLYKELEFTIHYDYEFYE